MVGRNLITHPMSPYTGRVLIALLTALTATGPVATTIYLPSLPAMAENLNATVGQAQLTLTVFLGGFAISYLIYGPLADRYGRRPVLLGGLLLYTLGSAACALAPTIETLIATRLLQSVGACAGPVIGRAVVRDLFEREQVARVLAWIGTALAVAPAAAPVIGGYLEVWFGWRTNFLATTLYGLVLTYLVWRRLGESTPELRVHAGFVRGMVADYLTLLRSPDLLGYSAIVGFGFAALFAFQTGAPIVVIDLIGLPPDAYGLLSLIGVAGYAGGSYFAGRMALKIELERMVLAGVLVALAGGGAMAGFALAGHLSLAAIFGPIFVYAVGMGLYLPNAIAGAINPHPEMAGTASALLGFFQTGLGALGSLAVVPFPSDTQLPMTLVVAAMTLAGFVTLLVMRHSRARARARAAAKM